MRKFSISVTITLLAAFLCSCTAAPADKETAYATTSTVSSAAGEVITNKQDSEQSADSDDYGKVPFETIHDDGEADGTDGGQSTEQNKNSGKDNEEGFDLPEVPLD